MTFRLLFTLFLMGCSAAAFEFDELRAENYDKATEGKTVFLKFYAPSVRGRWESSAVLNESLFGKLVVTNSWRTMHVDFVQVKLLLTFLSLPFFKPPPFSAPTARPCSPNGKSSPKHTMIIRTLSWIKSIALILGTRNSVKWIMSGGIRPSCTAIRNI